ncbi:hypothetical protein [Corynebacterium sp.]|uniref:hypothetical protein n=1 Tax=Corynebacterium sp. TaxID=1720 RepID=UPI0026DF6D86|nr:hypothetical protein [Corynebacterium sp.]MDO5512860.1 hypothetical protein [Corynebacterium sp.]
MRNIDIVESFIEGKLGPDTCEDALFLGEHFLGVFDGMSSPLAGDDQRSGREFARTAVAVSRALDPDISAREAMNVITEALRELGVRHAGPFGAVGAIYSVARREVWRVGDISVRINDEEHPGIKEVDTALAYYRAAYNAALLAAEPGTDIAGQDPGLVAATPLLTVQGYLANHIGPFGYGVFNGADIPPDYIEIIPVSPGDEVVLATDGFLSAAPTLAAAEEELRAAERRDPLAIAEMQSMAKCLRSGYNAHDDRTYVRFRLNSEKKEK